MPPLNTDLVLILFAIAVNVFVYGLYSSTFIHGGTVWGIRISPTKKQRNFQKVGKALKIIGLIGIVLLIVPVFIVATTVLFRVYLNGLLLILFLCAYAFILLLTAGVTCVIVWQIGKNLLYSPGANNALVLESVPIFPLIDSCIIDDAEYFVITLKGIYLFDKTDCCCFSIKYNDYSLRDLYDTSEIALVGLYFVQKYGDRFSFKIDYFNNDENKSSNGMPAVKSYIFKKR